MNSSVKSIGDGAALYNQELEKRGLTPELAKALGVKYLTPEQCLEVLGRPTYCSGMLIPYPGHDNYCRIKPLGNPNLPKYLSPKGSGCTPPYLAPIPGVDWSDVKADVTVPVVIAEGEWKGVSGTLKGGRTIGIGGVDMQTTLSTTGWEWKDRLVSVCFDHDAGQEPGTYKPGVANALGRLCSRLIEWGAKVKVAHIGCVPGLDLSQKWGLDDFLRQPELGGWEALFKTLADPPEWCEMLSTMLDTCVYVTGTNHTHVYNLEDGSRKSTADFHDTHAKKKRVEATEKGKTRVRYISKIWIEHPGCKTARGYILDPRHDFGFIDGYYSDDSEGRGAINLWHGYSTFKKGSQDRTEFVKQEWQRFMEGLFGEHWGWVGLWTGHLLNRPWEPTNQGVMLITSVQGIGKSLFGDILKDLCGKHGLECSSSRIFDKFNSDMEGKTFVMVNELDVKFSAREGQFNDLLSAETVSIECKGRDTIPLPNLRRWYFTTNASSPCRLSAGQRRILVVFPPRVEGDTRGEWGTWVDGVVAKFRRSPEDLAAVREWFDELWASKGEGQWNPTAPVEVTEASLELAEGSRSATQIIADDLLEAIQCMEGQWGAVHPDLKKKSPQTFSHLLQGVKAKGGLVSQKSIKVDGVVKDYTIYDLSRMLERKPKPSGGYTATVDPDEAKKRATALAAAYVKVQELVTGG